MPIQPRPTKASLLRTENKQTSSATPAAGLATTATTGRTPSSSSVSQVSTNAKATEGVKAFMAQQRNRMAVKKPTTSSDKEESSPNIRKRTTNSNVMTGAQRWGGGEESAPVASNTRQIGIVIKQAKASGKLNISSRGLAKIPEEVIKMYHVDPNRIVVDFTSSDAAWYDSVELTHFIAGDNAIKELDARVGQEFGALKQLDFRSNELTSLPDSLVQLKNLTCIQIPHNKFETVPSVLFQFAQLRELDLSHNEIKGHVVIGKNNIEQLDLSHNEISSIEWEEPATADEDYLNSLSKLNLGCNKLTELPKQLVHWTKLQELQVNQNKLKFLFSSATGSGSFVLPALVRLDASLNALSSFYSSSQITISLPKLIEVSFMTNRFTEEGLMGLASAPALQTLDISSNGLQDIPASVLGLEHLRRLIVRGNQLNSLPYELGKLEELVSIQCDGNPMRTYTSMSQTQLIETLKGSYLQQIEQAEKEKEQSTGETVASTIISGDGNQGGGEDSNVIADLSDHFTQKLSVTKKLDLSKQKLTELTIESITFVGDVPGIILLDHNEFTLFPTLLSNIAYFIVTLNLEHNRLTEFSLTISNGVVFSNLKTLKLNNNRIKLLECNEGAATSFPKLEEFNISHNGLVTLPDNLPAYLPSLKILNISANKLDVITEQNFGQGLEVLDLSNNDIGSLPSGLSTIESLKTLSVYGNRFRVPRLAIVDQGTQAILEFLKRRHNVPANN